LYIDFPLLITATPPLRGRTAVAAAAAAAAAIIGELLPLRLVNKIYLLYKVE